MHIRQALDDRVSRYDSLRNQLIYLGDFLDPELIPLCLAEADTSSQARQRLGSEAVRREFTQTAQLWQNAIPHPNWCGLTLLAINSVFWRTLGHIPEIHHSPEKGQSVA